ncbi:MAG: STAS domain-containing protein [Pseudomonadota bacterium]
MEISIENAGPFTRVRLYGRLDGKGMGSIYDTIVGLGSLGPGKLIVNLSDVDQATRAGTRALIIAAKMRHTRIGEKLVIEDASPEIAAVLKGSGVDHFIEVTIRSELQSHVAAWSPRFLRVTK